jgi:hypothetical protein
MISCSRPLLLAPYLCVNRETENCALILYRRVLKYRLLCVRARARKWKRMVQSCKSSMMKRREKWTDVVSRRDCEVTA